MVKEETYIPDSPYVDYQQMPMPMSSNPYMDYQTADTIQQTKINNFLTQINPELLLEDIEHRIRKMRKDNFSQRWIPIEKEAKPVHPLLIANLISNLSSFLTNNVTMSNVTNDKINDIMRLLIRDVVHDLWVNAKIYGLENDYSERNRISQVVCSSVFFTLSRAKEGMESKRLFKSMSLSGELEDRKEKKSFKDFLKLG